MNFVEKTFGRTANRMFQSAFIYAQVREGKIPDIYLQDSKYFDKYKDEIKKMWGDGIGYEDKVAMHFRRGDYVTTYKDFYVDLSQTDYYQKAMSLFPNGKFLLFSDDNDWLAENWQGEYEFANGDEESDLKRFASCKGQIIGNSSWSYWGAYLSPHNGKVIYPKEWYKDGVQRTKCPESWICI